MRNVIFDLDGTLADTSGDLIDAANACFERRGVGAQLDHAADAVTAFHGGRAMLRLGFSRLGMAWTDADVDADYSHLLEFYAANIDRHTRLYPNAVAAVERLRAEGFAVAICTNKPEALARLLLERLGIMPLFGALIGADTLPTRKPDPAPLRAAIEGVGGDPRRSLLVGDTDTDRNTARAAGVPCVLVTFGPEGRGIARLEPEALLDDFSDLPDLAVRLLGA